MKIHQRHLIALAACFFLSYFSVLHAEEKPVYYVYLAGPEVFLDKPIEAGEKKKALIAKLSNKNDWSFVLEGLYPLDNSIPDFKNDFDTGMRIYEANIALMDKAHFIAANMVRFRGPSMDVGTAYEMGYMAGADKPVFAYYEAKPFYRKMEKPALLTERVKDYWHVDPESPGKDKDGIHIENFQMIDNLMMVGAYSKTGYPVAENFEALIMNIADYIQSKK